MQSMILTIPHQEEDEIIIVLKKLPKMKAPAASKIAIDKIKMWCNNSRIFEARIEKDTKKWDNIIEILKFVLRKEGRISDMF